MAIGFPTKSNWSAGDILTAAQMDDLAGTVNLLQNSAFPIMAGKNFLINGGMDIWQRGTSFTNPAGIYTADRWTASVAGTCTVSQLTSSLPSNFRYGIQWVAGAANSYAQLKTFIETANVIPLQGKTVTISGWVKASANYVGNWIFQNYYSTSTDSSASVTTQNGSNIAIATSATTTWTFFSVTFTVPATALGLGVFFIPDNAAQVNTGTIQMTGVQLELGSAATTFSRAGGSIGGELALCQRYYQKSYPQGTTVPTNSTSAGVVFVPGSSVASTAYFAQVFLPITMRTAPTVTIYSYASSTVSVVSSSSGVDLAASSGVANLIGDRGFTVQNSSGGTITAGAGGFDFHYAASGEL